MSAWGCPAGESDGQAAMGDRTEKTKAGETGRGPPGSHGCPNAGFHIEPRPAGCQETGRGSSFRPGRGPAGSIRQENPWGPARGPGSHGNGPALAGNRLGIGWQHMATGLTQAARRPAGRLSERPDVDRPGWTMVDHGTGPAIGPAGRIGMDTQP